MTATKIDNLSSHARALASVEGESSVLSKFGQRRASAFDILSTKLSSFHREGAYDEQVFKSKIKYLVSNPEMFQKFQQKLAERKHLTVSRTTVQLALQGFLDDELDRSESSDFSNDSTLTAVSSSWSSSSSSTTTTTTSPDPIRRRSRILSYLSRESPSPVIVTDDSKKRPSLSPGAYLREDFMESCDEIVTFDEEEEEEEGQQQDGIMEVKCELVFE